MRPLSQIIESTIINHRMLCEGDTVVLAVSGGPDSVCLLHLMSSLAIKQHWQIHVAHIHHGIRGTEADTDASFVADLAHSLGYPFHLCRSDVPRIAEERGLGLEEAGRFARYQYLAHLARQIGARAIATGHHADDQAETILMNLLRGAGGTGLAGIQLVRVLGQGLRVIRPLLLVSRFEIEQYLEAQCITPRYDHTNNELDQTRNRIRHELIPLLKSYNPRITEALARTADILRSDEQYLMQRVEAYLAEHLVHRYGLTSLSIDSIGSQPLALQRRIVRRMLGLISWEAKQSVNQFGATAGLAGPGLHVHVDFGRVDNLLDLIQASTTNRQPIKRSWSAPLPGGGVARLSQGQLFFLSHNDCELGAWCHAWHGVGEQNLPEISTRIMANIIAHPWSGWDPRVHMDAGLVGHDLILRSWRPGDRVSIGERAGSKKLSDLFIDAKVPAPYRTRIPIIEHKGEIVAVAGLLVAPQFRPAPEAAKAIQLQLRNAAGECKDCGSAKSNIY
ncbi:MAG: tRNA lysidine(34) synthetase TilS [Bacillota bacterium]